MCSRNRLNVIWYIEGIYTTLSGCNTARVVLERKSRQKTKTNENQQNRRSPHGVSGPLEILKTPPSITHPILAPVMRKAEEGLVSFSFPLTVVKWSRHGKKEKENAAAKFHACQGLE